MNNKKLYNTQETNSRTCNCTNGPENCIFGAKCLTKNVVYKATKKKKKEEKEYIGLASTTLKERYQNHLSSFNNEAKSKFT